MSFPTFFTFNVTVHNLAANNVWTDYTCRITQPWFGTLLAANLPSPVLFIAAMCLFVWPALWKPLLGKNRTSDVDGKKGGWKNKITWRPHTAAGQKLVGKLIVNYLNAAISVFCAAGMCEARAAITLVAIVCLYSLLLHKSFTTIKKKRAEEKVTAAIATRTSCSCSADCRV